MVSAVAAALGDLPLLPPRLLFRPLPHLRRLAAAAAAFALFPFAFWFRVAYACTERVPVISEYHIPPLTSRHSRQPSRGSISTITIIGKNAPFSSPAPSSSLCSLEATFRACVVQLRNYLQPPRIRQPLHAISRLSPPKRRAERL